MRLKAIPSEVIGTAKAHPVLFGLGALAVAGFFFLRGPNSQSSGGSTNSIYSSSYPMYSTASGLTVGGGSAPVDNGMNLASLMAVEQQKASDAHEEAMANLQIQSDIATSNHVLGMASIEASMFTASTSLAQSMLSSQSTSLMGAFFGPDGKTWGFGLGQTKMAGSKLGSRNNAIMATNQQGINALNSFISSMGNNNNVVPLSGPSAASIVVSGSAASPMLPVTGTSANAKATNDDSYIRVEQQSVANLSGLAISAPNFG